MKMYRQQLVAGAVWLAALGAAPWLAAAEPEEPPAVTVLPPTTTETPGETIAKCLEDLASKDTAKRCRAVLVLGKYDAPNARQAVIGALTDAEPAIRRSALVALTEKEIPIEAAVPILQRLGDPDVQVRRQAASFAAHAERAFRIQRFRVERGAVDPTGADRPERLPPEVKEAILKAFVDPDTVVRKAMTTVFPAFADDLPPATVQQLLHDPESEIRARTLLYSHLVFPEEGKLVTVVAPLAADPDAHVRLALAQVFGRRFFPSLELSPAVRMLLIRLTADTDFAVATEAHLSLLLQGEVASWIELRRRLDDPQMKAETAGEIISALPHLPDKGRLAFRDLLGHQRPAYRVLALRTAGYACPDALDQELLLRLLDNTTGEVRQVAADLLLQEKELAPDLGKRLAASPHPEIRQRALLLSARLEAAAAAPLLLDLLLDDSTDLRTRAMYELGKRRLPGWQPAMVQSLDDPEPRIRQLAADQLLRFGGADGRAALAKYLTTCTDETFRREQEAKLEALKSLQRGPVPGAPAR